MSRRVRRVALAGLGLVALTAPLWGPRLLREVEWFQVRRVEISGTHLLAPHQVLAASGVRQGQNVWDDLARLESALRAHPAVAGAAVTRRLPHTLRIRIEEKRPVAYVEMEALAPITARGEILPIDPTRARMDLPVIRGAWAKTAAERRRGLLAETERLANADPTLLARVSEIRGEGKSLERLVLTHASAEIVLPVGADATRLAQLRAVLADLERRMPPREPGVTPPAARVDLRFDEQVVVRLPSSV